MNATLKWFKSSYSGSEGGACLEVAVAPGTVHIRDSKNPADAPTLQISPSTWSAFLTATPPTR